MLLTPYKLEFLWGINPKKSLGFYRENDALKFKFSLTPTSSIDFNETGLSIFTSHTQHNDFALQVHGAAQLQRLGIGGILSACHIFQVHGAAQIEKLGINMDIANLPPESPSWQFGIFGDMGVLGHMYAEALKVGRIGVNYTFEDTIPANYEFAVKGKILSQEIMVLEAGNEIWPDYVFENDYKLKEISEVEKFINDNKHLPDIPSRDASKIIKKN
ncbi:MAG: hypothetical protein K8S23_05550 [Candidatus Cloacimonetes bacterium]|nr:hypothetical protein [Candidatus Cloacimonadota bacterium]